MSDETVQEKARVIEHPMDGFIQIALAVDEEEVRVLYNVVCKAVNSLKWELENTPVRWANVRAEKTVQLSHWVFLQDKLWDYWKSLDAIPF